MQEKLEKNVVSFVKSYFKVSIGLGLYLVLDPIDTKKYILAKQIACILVPKMYCNPFLRSILIFALVHFQMKVTFPQYFH